MKYQISKKKLAELIKLRDHALQLEREGVELPEWETVHASPDDTEEMKAYFFHQEFVIKMVMRRRELGISQEDLAKILKTTQSVISRFEHFGRKPTLDFMLKLTNALNMKFDFLHENQVVISLTERQKEFVARAASEMEQTFEIVVSNLIDNQIDNQNFGEIYDIKLSHGNNTSVDYDYNSLNQHPKAEIPYEYILTDNCNTLEMDVN